MMERDTLEMAKGYALVLLLKAAAYIIYHLWLDRIDTFTAQALADEMLKQAHYISGLQGNPDDDPPS